MKAAIGSCRRGGHRVLQLPRALFVPAPQLSRPCFVYRRCAIASGFDQGTHGFCWRRQNLHCAAAVVPKLPGIVTDPDEFGQSEHRRRSISKLEVQLSTNRQYDVSITHVRAAHSADHRGMRVRHKTATFTSIEIHAAETIEKGDEFR